MYQGILEAITNRQTWTDSFVITDENNAPIDISAAQISISVRDQRNKNFVLTGSTSDGHVTMPNGGTDGVFAWEFSPTETRKLCAVTHDVSVYVTIGGKTEPLVIATIPVLEGVAP